MKSKVTINGNKKEGYILNVTDKDSDQDMALTELELKEIQKKLNKKFPKSAN